MEQQGAEEYSGGVEKWRLLAKKKKLQFITAVSFFSLLFSYFSGFSSSTLHFLTLILSLFAHAFERKYVFLVCNAILALLVNNFSLRDGTKQMPAMLLVEEDGAASASLENVDEVSPVAGEEEMVHQNEFELEEGDEDEEDDTVEEVNDASVSTEELNLKCEEFIRKMKEEIRVEAQCKNQSFS